MRWMAGFVVIGACAPTPSPKGLSQVGNEGNEGATESGCGTEESRPLADVDGIGFGEWTVADVLDRATVDADVDGGWEPNEEPAALRVMVTPDAATALLTEYPRCPSVFTLKGTMSVSSEDGRLDETWEMTASLQEADAEGAVTVAAHHNDFVSGSLDVEDWVSVPEDGSVAIGARLDVFEEGSTKGRVSLRVTTEGTPPASGQPGVPGQDLGEADVVSW